jgi:hypothetical protein
MKKCSIVFQVVFVVVFWWNSQGLNSGLGTCKADTLLLEPCLLIIWLWLFWRWGLTTICPGWT